jgi:glycosyltransferase involved in cell wall biosynthesis
MDAASGRRRIAFITYEWPGFTSGGAGVAIAGLVRALAAEGWSVTVIKHFSGTPEFDGTCYDLEDLAKHEYTGQIHDSMSLQWARALDFLQAKDGPFDAIEFFDYGGSAYRYLKEYTWIWPAKVFVRNHGTTEAINSSVGLANHDLPFGFSYAMERYCIQHADIVFVQPGHSLDSGTSARLVFSRPPEYVDPAWLTDNGGPVRPNEVAYYGSLDVNKGINVFIDIARLAALQTDEPKLNFVVYSGSEPDAILRRRTLVNGKAAATFEFASRAKVPTVARAGVVLFPSYTETFGYALREVLLNSGVALARPISAFLDPDFDVYGYNSAKTLNLMPPGNASNVEWLTETRRILSSPPHLAHVQPYFYDKLRAPNVAIYRALYAG